MLRRLSGIACLAGLVWGCASAPRSAFPSAASALERMRATHACSRSIRAEASIDYFDSDGRVRGNLLYLAALPDQLRFDVFSPFGVTLATLTSDGHDFALYDFRAKLLSFGPANTCNVSRFTRVPVPPHALVQLLRGEAPVLVHEPSAARISWDSGLFGSGRYVIDVSSRHAASQRIELVPQPADWNRPWNEQRVRVLKVTIAQHGAQLYSAELADHERARTAAPSVDPDGLAPTVLPSGPACSAEVPGRVRVEVPETGQDLIITNKRVHHNPPLDGASFRQNTPAGVRRRYVACGR